YSSPEDPQDLGFLMRHSPYHTLPEKIEAPAILTIALGNDDRVAPWHRYKMHAAWLADNVSHNPILLRTKSPPGTAAVRMSTGSSIISLISGNSSSGSAASVDSTPPGANYHKSTGAVGTRACSG